MESFVHRSRQIKPSFACKNTRILEYNFVMLCNELRGRGRDFTFKVTVSSILSIDKAFMSRFLRWVYHILCNESPNISINILNKKYKNFRCFVCIFFSIYYTCARILKSRKNFHSKTHLIISWSFSICSSSFSLG